MNTGKSYDTITVGDSHTLEVQISEKMIEDFAELSGDYNPVHMDDAYCQEHGMESRIAHGMLVLSFLSTLIGMYLPGEGSVWMSQSIDFISPARVGDTLEITGSVVAKDNSNALRLNIVTMKVAIINQARRMVARGTVKVSLK